MRQAEMLPLPVPQLRRPLTPILERRENSPEANTPEPVCTFDPEYYLSAPDPHIIQEHVTSSGHIGHVTGCPTNHNLSEVQQVIQEVRESPRDRESPCVLDTLCELYSHTRQAIDDLEEQLVDIKRQLKQASEDYQLNHERITSARSRHRLVKGLREVTDEKASLWWEQCRNLELGYIQDRPELEQLKVVHSILKASITELVESNKYLVTFVEVLKKKRIKLYELKFLEEFKHNPGLNGNQTEFIRQQFEEALKHQMQVKNIGKPSLRKYLNYRDLMKKFGRNMPRPPFTPLNVFKIEALLPYLGKSSLQYGHGQVCTLKVDINKHLLGDEGTFGRITPEAKETWVLAGRNCFKTQTTRSLIGDSVLSNGTIGYRKLPSIGSAAIVKQFATWAPRKSVVRRTSCTEIGQRSQKLSRRLKQTSFSDSCVREDFRKSKHKKDARWLSSSRVSINNWGNTGDTEVDSIGQGLQGSHEEHGTAGMVETHPSFTDQGNAKPEVHKC